MKKILTLSNEQAFALYIMLNKLKLEAKKNKSRYNFLKVIEDDVFNYEETLTEISEKLDTIKRSTTVENLDSQRKLAKECVAKMKELQSATKKYTFNDREVFSQVRSIFELECGTDLEGRFGMLYEEIDKAFVDVKEINDQNN